MMHIIRTIPASFRSGFFASRIRDHVHFHAGDILSQGRPRQGEFFQGESPSPSLFDAQVRKVSSTPPFLTISSHTSQRYVYSLLYLDNSCVLRRASRYDSYGYLIIYSL